MNDYSLVRILRSDPDFASSLSKRKEIAKQDKAALDKAAKKYTDKYQEEIIEGTRKAQKLLSEGASRGLTEEEVMKQLGRFLPTVRTPILNMLYFILRESEEIDRELGEYRDSQRREQNRQYGGMYEDHKYSDNVEEPPDMEEYLYGNMTHETFKKIKKLKTLTTSPNIEEATLAFQKCRELCDKYGLDYARIPSLKTG